jgi:hypothetical protein
MVSYDSPIGKRQFTGQGPPMKETVIPDASGYVRSPVNRPPRDHQQVDEAALLDFAARMGGGPGPQQPMSQEQAVLEQQFQEAREAKRLGHERLSDGARRRIEMLVGMTRGHRTVQIENNTYVLQTLRDKELANAILQASAYDGTVQSPFEVRKQLLARSLVQVAGMDMDQFVGSSELDAKVAFIEEMDHYLLGRLYDEYLEMVKEARERYAIKNNTDAQEVVEDLKK